MTKDHGIHPAAMLLPLMPEERFAELRRDIERNGLMEPITLSHDGLIVDGRHRYRACREAGVEPQFKTLPDGADVVGFVFSKNLMRRDLTPSQRAMAVIAMKDLVAQLQKESKKRMRSGMMSPELARLMEIAGKGNVKRTHRDKEAGTTAAKLAQIAQVSTPLVEGAMRVARESPALRRAVEKGEIGVDAAVKKLQIKAGTYTAPTDYRKEYLKVVEENCKLLEENQRLRLTIAMLRKEARAGLSSVDGHGKEES